MQVEGQPQAKSASVFNIRHNWNHLANRPAFQEPVIDGVRALAILWVVVLHIVFFQFYLFPNEATFIFTNSFTSWVVNGALGVDLFFVISGFLMGSILFAEMKKSGGLQCSRFYIRRFLRLIPVYTAAILLALYLMHGRPGAPVWGNAENFWANLLYVNNFLPIAKQYIGWCWSLAIEEQFYIILPTFILLFMALGKGRLRILAVFMLLSVAIRFTVINYTGIVPPYRAAPYTPAWNSWFDLIYDKPWMRFGGLLAGVTGAYLNCYYLPQLKRFFSRTWLVNALAVVCVGVIAHIATTSRGSVFFDQIPYLAREIWQAVHRDIFSIATIFLILAAIHSEKLFAGLLRRFLSSKAFYPIAQLSYSCYLVHEMLFVWLFPKIAPLFTSRLGNYGAMAIDGLIALLLVLAIASTFYVLIERPCMRLRSHPTVLSWIAFFQRRPNLVPATEEA
jgi:peptidoglycan/LPS O-acetylase OafA/YrhL